MQSAGLKPLLVLFKMQGCPHCTPLVQQETTPLSSFGNRVILKVADADKDHAVAERFQVHSYPTIALVVPGGPTLYYEGRRDKASIEAWVGRHVPASS